MKLKRNLLRYWSIDVYDDYDDDATVYDLMMIIRDY